MNRRERAICERLVKHGEKIFKAGAEAYPIKFKKPQDLDEAQYQAAKNLVHDLEHNPHAFVIGCIVDRQIKADRAWVLPYLLSQRIGSPGEPRFDFCTLLELSEDEILVHMEGPPSLHRFTQKMSQYIHAALHHIADKYEGRAENIWSGCPSSASLVYRFLSSKGSVQRSQQWPQTPSSVTSRYSSATIFRLIFLLIVTSSVSLKGWGLFLLSHRLSRSYTEPES